MGRTVNEIAEQLGVEKPIAYGLVRFLETKKLAIVSGQKREPGSKGKGSSQYVLSDNVVEELKSMLLPLSTKV